MIDAEAKLPVIVCGEVKTVTLQQLSALVNDKDEISVRSVGQHGELRWNTISAISQCQVYRIISLTTKAGYSINVTPTQGLCLKTHNKAAYLCRLNAPIATGHYKDSEASVDRIVSMSFLLERKLVYAVQCADPWHNLLVNGIFLYDHAC